MKGTCISYLSGSCKEREAFVENLKEHGIATNIHYPTPIMEQAGISGVSRTDAAVSGDKADLRRGKSAAVISGHDRGRDFARLLKR